MVDRAKPFVGGLGHIVDGYEYHYPDKINEANVEAIQRALGDHHDIYCIASGLHTWLAILEYNYHPLIYRYTEDVTIRWQSGRSNVRVWLR
ncbi:MAG: hypothetical protein ACE5II_01265 [Anaerolineae bacterium]